MRPIFLVLSAMLVCEIGAVAIGQAAVTRDQFPPKTTGDLVALCTATKDDPLMTPAVNFCNGFAEGAVEMALCFSVSSLHAIATNLPHGEIPEHFGEVAYAFLVADGRQQLPEGDGGEPLHERRLPGRVGAAACRGRHLASLHAIVNLDPESQVGGVVPGERKPGQVKAALFVGIVVAARTVVAEERLVGLGGANRHGRDEG